jgi:LCP family protein required for cell wall assembly
MSRKERHGRTGNRKPSLWKSKKFKWSLVVLLILVLGIIGYYAYSIGSFVSGIQNPKDKTQEKVQVEEWTGTDRVNIVLLGVDNRDKTDKNPRSDSILIVSLDPKTKKANVMSVMRDTWLRIPGYDFEKINVAHALGGPRLTINTLKEFLKIPIHYYVKTDFQGFIKIVDALGGVTIDVEKDLYYEDDGVYDINLKKGVQRLNGKQALMYVRFRHDAMSDFARTERQRKFLAAVADEMSSPAAIAKLPKILSAVEPYVETNMGAGDMLKLAKLGLEVEQSGIQSMQVPPMEAMKEGYAGGGQAVLIPNVSETRKRVYDFLGMDQSKLPKDGGKDQPQEYYQEKPVVPQNPKVEPEKPAPKPPEEEKKKDDKKPADQPGTGTGTQPGTGTGTQPGTGTGTQPGTGTGTQPGTGTGTQPGTGTGTQPGTGTGTQPGTGTGTQPGTGMGTQPGTGTGTQPGTGTGTQPGTGTGTQPGTGTETPTAP